MSRIRTVFARLQQFPRRRGNEASNEDQQHEQG
jgi:hypothetical protein